MNAETKKRARFSWKKCFIGTVLYFAVFFLLELIAARILTHVDRVENRYMLLNATVLLLSGLLPGIFSMKEKGNALPLSLAISGFAAVILLSASPFVVSGAVSLIKLLFIALLLPAESFLFFFVLGRIKAKKKKEKSKFKFH